MIDIRVYLDDADTFSGLFGSSVRICPDHRYDGMESIGDVDFVDDPAVAVFYLDSPTDLRALADKLESTAQLGQL